MPGAARSPMRKRRSPAPADGRRASWMPALLAALALALVFACLPTVLAHAADGGSVELGVEVGTIVEEPAAGDEGSVELGAVVGLGTEADGSVEGDTGGTVELGAWVGYRSPDEVVEGVATVTFDAGKGAFGDGGSTLVATPAMGDAVAMPDPAPKRAGWKFGGWHVAGAPDESWDSEGESAVPLGAAWDFAQPVTGDATLHARWEMRLDVTVPVSVAFAIDPGTGEAHGPDADAYALKSRTVRPVEVAELALESQQEELEGFFRLEGADGATVAASADGGAAAEGARAGEPDVGGGAPSPGEDPWREALAGTRLSLAPEGASSIELPFADDDASAPVWLVSHRLTDGERAAFRVVAFSYGAQPDEDPWQGGDPSVRLPLALGLKVSEKLGVRPDVEGTFPLARLKVTVAA